MCVCVCIYIIHTHTQTNRQTDTQTHTHTHAHTWSSHLFRHFIHARALDDDEKGGKIRSHRESRGCKYAVHSYIMIRLCFHAHANFNCPTRKLPSDSAAIDRLCHPNYDRGFSTTTHIGLMHTHAHFSLLTSHCSLLTLSHSLAHTCIILLTKSALFA